MLGEWDNPYKTMDFKNEADEIRALGKLIAKGYVYRGLKPVYWCIYDRTALAEGCTMRSTCAFAAASTLGCECPVLTDAMPITKSR